MYEQISANKRRTVLLIAVFVVIVVGIGWAFDVLLGYGAPGLVIALVFAAGAAFVSWWKSDRLALAVSRARPADPVTQARLHNVVEGLAIAAGIPKPAVFIVDDPAPNAFATGRNPQHSSIAVTTGLLEKMDRAELEGVIGHELSHIRNYDILVSTIAVSLVGTAVLLSEWGLRFLWFGGGRRHRDENAGGGPFGLVLAIGGILLLVLAPILAQVMQRAISRRRELLADVSAVELTRYPPGLISALEKLRDDSAVVRSATRATAHMWIEQPTEQARDQDKMAWLNRLFNTHPPMEERIVALKRLTAASPR
jgi:heat shock protein HtpX